MSDKTPKTKKNFLLTIVAVLLVIIVIVLIIVIFVNRDNDDEHEQLVSKDEVSQTSVDITDMPVESVSMVTDESSGEDLSVTDNIADNKTDKGDSKDSQIQVKLGNYRGLTVSYERVIITDEDIDAALEQLKTDNIDTVALSDRAFQEGDMAIVTLEASVDNKLIKELSSVSNQIILGEGTLPQDIEKEILGRHIGDVFYMELEYPENYAYVPEVAGKTVNFAIALVDGFEFYTPEINDEFIRQVTKYASVDEYRVKEKERLQKEVDDKATENMMKNLKQQVVDGCTYSDNIDKEITKQYILKLQQEDENIREEYYFDAPVYYSLMYDMSLQDYQKYIMDEVTLEVKYNYALDEIAKVEGLSSREEADKLVNDTAVRQ